MNIFIGTKPNPQHIQTLMDCKRTDTGMKLIGILKEAVASYKDSLVAADEPVRIHRLQGSVKCLEELIDAIEISGDVMERLRK